MHDSRLFEKIARALQQRLRDGHYPHGIPLPGERELTHEFGVARVTIRSALQRLQEQGLVTRLPGIGTFPVAQPSTASHSKIRAGLLDTIVRFGERTRTLLESAAHVHAPADIARLLQLNEGARVLRIVRVRKSRRQPLLCTEVYLPPEIASSIDPAQLDDMPLLSAIERAGHPFTQGEQELTAVIADAEIARRLAIEVGAPVLQVKRIVRDAAGTPIQYLIGHYAPTHYRYRMKMSRTGGATRVWIADF